MNVIEAKQKIEAIQRKMVLTGNWDECRFDAIEPLSVINEEGRIKYGPKWKDRVLEDFL